MEDDSASIIRNLEVFKQAAFINANKNFEDSDDCGDWDGQFCCKITLFGQIFYRIKFYFGSEWFKNNR